jgi:hypothetical protein
MLPSDCAAEVALLDTRVEPLIPHRSTEKRRIADLPGKRATAIP